MLIKKFLGNRKAMMTMVEALEMVAQMILLLTVVFGLIFLFTNDKQDKYRIPDNFQENLLVNRLISSPDCFAYVNDVFRVYPGIIDINKFDDERFEKCFDIDKSKYAVRVNLISVNSDFEKYEILSSNYNENKPSQQFPIIKVIVKMFDRSEKLGKLVIEIQDVTLYESLTQSSEDSIEY